MKFAIGILLVLVLVCALGSVIPQGNPPEWYTQNYPSQAAGAIMLFGLGDVFHCWWFLALALILCVNLLGCNLIHLPGLVRRTREGFKGEKAVSSSGRQPAAVTDNPEKLFQSLGFRRIRRGNLAPDDSGLSRSWVYAVKNTAGIWGPWLCHLGMLIVIIGFGLGQQFKKEYTVYGVPGQTKQIGDTAYELTIDDFEITVGEANQAEQYTASLTLTNTDTSESSSGQASVNHPLSLSGMKLYQNSTGWAATARIYKDDQLLQETTLCVGEYAAVEDMPDLVFTLADLYPDYVEDPVTGEYSNASWNLHSPAYLYRIYYKNQVLGMNILKEDEVITVEDYKIHFGDPQLYTLIQIKKDPFMGLTAIGGLIVLAGLLLAFYLQTREIWAIMGEGDAWQVYGRSKKAGMLFTEEIRRAAEAVRPGESGHSD